MSNNLFDTPFERLDRRYLPVAVAAGYALLSGIWITYSDQWAANLVDAASMGLMVQTAKGQLFVGGSAMLLYLILSWTMRRFAGIEQALTQKESRLRGLLQHAPLAIVVVDGLGVVLEANASALNELAGIDGLVGRPFATALRPEDHGPFRTLLARALTRERSWEEVTVVDDAGRLRRYELRAVPVEREATQTRLMLILSDVTAFRQTEVRLRRLNRLYGIWRDLAGAAAEISDSRLLFQSTCRTLVTHGGFAAAWIADVATPDGQHRIISRWANEAQAEMAAADDDLIQDAVRTAEPRLRHGGPAGAGAQGAFPIREGGTVKWVLYVAAADADLLDEETVDLLRQVAGQLGLALRSHPPDAQPAADLRRIAGRLTRDSQAAIQELTTAWREAPSDDPLREHLLAVANALERLRQDMDQLNDLADPAGPPR